MRVRALLKSMILRWKLWRITYFEPKFLVKFRFIQFSTKPQILNQKYQNVYEFEPNFNNSSNKEPKLRERVRFWIKLLNTRQNLNQNFYNASDCGAKLFLDNQNSLDNSLWKIIFFGSSCIVKTTQLAYSCCIGKLYSEGDVFEEKKNIFWLENFK